MTNFLANGFVWFLAAGFLVPVSEALTPQLNFPQRVPEIYRAFGIYTDHDGALVTPFGRWIPQNVQFAPNPIKKCPCEDTASGQPKCRPYDPGFQAATLEEALSNFKDTTVSNAVEAKSIVPNKYSQAFSALKTGIQQEDGNAQVCPKNDGHCLGCTKYTLMNMLDQLESQPASAANAKMKDEILKTLDDNGLNTADIIPRCPELTVSLPKADLRNGYSTLVQDIDECISDTTQQAKLPHHPAPVPSVPDLSTSTLAPIRQKYNWTAHRSHNHGSGRPLRSRVGSSIRSHVGSTVPEWRRSFRTDNLRRSRTKRQAEDGIPEEIVQVFDIKCQPRGSPVSQGSTYVGLCGVCWKWGVLDTQYSPSYINLMVCDEETKCLSGWGSCKQRNRNFQVLKNTGTESNPRYESVSINVPMMCDCQVQAGSALHNFVRA